MSIKLTAQIFHWILIGMLTLSAISCQSPETLFSLVPASESGIDFVNQIENKKELNIFNYRNFYNGGGVAIGDINRDGLADIFFTANMGPNKLYLNQGDFRFEDISISAGIAESTRWSTGVTMVDINADGWLDIYVSNAGPDNYTNHQNELYINNGDLTFTEKAEDYHLDSHGLSTQTTFFDYDKDGDLDAFILDNSPYYQGGLKRSKNRLITSRKKAPGRFKRYGDRLLRNDGATFTDVSEEAGIYSGLIGYGLGVMISDINGDLYPDIYVANDFFEQDYLYINNRDGSFREEINQRTQHLCFSAMGIDIADMNNDGLNEIFITDMLPAEDKRLKTLISFDSYNNFKLKQNENLQDQFIQNTLQLNQGDGFFSEIAYFSGIAATDWSWAGLLFDMDNDGLRDIFITNGILHDITSSDFKKFVAPQIKKNMAQGEKGNLQENLVSGLSSNPLPNYAFRNQGDLVFQNHAQEWGMDLPSTSNGAAYGDLDNDGDLDLVINNVNMQAFVYRNHADKTSNHFIKLNLEGKAPNTYAIGSTIKLYIQDKTIVQEMMPIRGFQSSVDYMLTFGLGNTSHIDSVRIIWPDDQTQILTYLSVDTTYVFSQKNAKETYQLPQKPYLYPLLSEIPNPQIIPHQENEFIDFDYERLLPNMISQEGPALAIGDLNQDGYEDVFIGGAQGQASTIYFHDGVGNLIPSKQSVLNEDVEYEDTAAAFFDADGDHDLDLWVGSGGNQSEKKLNHKNRLYLNDGNGYFTHSPFILPTNHNNISTILPLDFDQDGDLDVFIGSRSIPGKYGFNPEHLLLKNTGSGHFEIAEQEQVSALQQTGMVTDAVWADLTKTGTHTLIVTTDWGSPHLFQYDGHRFNRIHSGLDELSGWWNTVEATDLDNDGDLDLILGNRGHNIRYQPTQEQPMKIWIGDFDQNGAHESILTHAYQGANYPIHTQEELNGQIVSFKKQTLTADLYASSSIEELMADSILKTAITKTVNYATSVIVLNEGEGDHRFLVKPLPYQVQFSNLQAVSCSDLNADGYLDLVLGGNQFEWKPQYGKLDASYGQILLNDQNGAFTPVSLTKRSLCIREEIKHIEPFSGKNGAVFLLVAINDQPARVFDINLINQSRDLAGFE